jgi:tetratricopeptide (TPR) repeat protein
MDTPSSADSQPETPTGGNPWLLAAVVAVVATVTMCGALGGPFIHDDIPLIQGNSYVHGFEHWRRWFSGAFVDTNVDPSLAKQARTFFRPLVLASYALDWQWTAGQPWGFHLTNLLIHATNSFLLLLLLRGWVVRQWAALVAAVVFAVHPVQTETVAWISGRTDSLCLLGLLSATLGLRRMVTVRAEGGRRLVGGAGILGGLLLAFGSKEAAVVFPALFGVELWSLHRGRLDSSALRRLATQTALPLALALAYVIWRLLFSPGPVIATPPAIQRVPFVLEALGRYAALVLVPTDVTMGRGLLHFENGTLTPVWGYVGLGALALGGIVWVALAKRLDAPAVSLGFFATLSFLMPVSSIVWLGYDVLVSPRFLYIPMVGVAFTIAAGLSRAHGVLLGRASRSACALGLTALVAVSFLRSLDFSSEDAFWQRELEAAPSSLPAQRYFVSREIRERRPRAGVTLAQHFFATSPLPDHMRAPLLLEALTGLATLIPDRSEASLRALKHFVRELEAGNGGQLALPDLQLSLSVAGHSRLANRLRGEYGRLDLLIAELAARLGDDAEAKQSAERALVGCDDCWTQLVRAARVLALCGELDRARELASRVARLTPDEASHALVKDIVFARQLHELSKAGESPVLTSQYYAIFGAFGRAYQAAFPAFRQPPDDPDALRGLAELAIRAGDVAQARELLMRRLTPQQVEAEIEEVMASVPWRDHVRPADEWAPEVLALASAG